MRQTHDTLTSLLLGQRRRPLWSQHEDDDGDAVAHPFNRIHRLRTEESDRPGRNEAICRQSVQVSDVRLRRWPWQRVCLALVLCCP